MWQTDSNFFIAINDQPDALTAIKSLAGKETIKDLRGDSHFSWVDTADFLAAKDLSRAMYVWRWELELDDHQNVVGICFFGEKLGDDKILFDAIAPFVKDDSFIEMRGEEDEGWRWVFKHGKCIEIHPQVVWPEVL